MKTISIETFNIISILIVVFYLLVFLSFLLISCEKKYSLSSKETLTNKVLMMAPSFGNYKKCKGVLAENPVPVFYKKSESPVINKNTGLILGVHNSSPSFFIVRGYFFNLN